MNTIMNLLSNLMDILSNLNGSTIFSILATIGSCIWTGYTYHHGEKTNRELQKMKGEQGKSLESYKIFTKQRHERIIAFYDSLCVLLGACEDLSLKLIIARYPDFSTLSVDDFQKYVKNLKILPQDEVVLIKEFRHCRYESMDTPNLEKALYRANYNKYISAYNESNSKWVKLKLYISPEDEKRIGEFFEKVRTMFRKYLNPDLKDRGLQIHEESDTPFELQCQDYCDELTIELSSDIIPILRKNLRK